MPKLKAPRSGCPIATSLDLVGDRWTLLIVRDMIGGKTKFGDFLRSPEGITTNVLTERLGAMEREGLIELAPYSRRPLRYEYRLTEKGRALWPVLQAYCRWANGCIPGTWIMPFSFMRPVG
ncbi:winged helix-turn-helix transcriptional regulator [Sphingosinicella sp.]|uniref:winged helix-turn-helix transcriptional regulator n=1 Tax=Sphingosinicella sp. TaxID=1917971 RepID=UPI004037DBF8